MVSRECRDRYRAHSWAPGPRRVACPQLAGHPHGGMESPDQGEQRLLSRPVRLLSLEFGLGNEMMGVRAAQSGYAERNTAAMFLRKEAVLTGGEAEKVIRS